MSFPRYASYRQTASSWLRAVPEHWEVRRLREIGPLLKGSGGSKEDETDDGIPCVRYGDLYTTHDTFITKSRAYVTDTRAAEYASIRYGDVLFAASGEKLEEIGRSAVNLISETAVCGGDLVILRPSIKVVPEFLGYACDSKNAAFQKTSMGRGTTVKHIYPDELRNLVIALPPSTEQHAIARFLAVECAKIDALVAKQRRMIELLREKRQAVISHAVTKGLKPTVPMKHSSIAWLGEVPSHWNVTGLTKCLRSLVDYRGRTPTKVDDGVLLITARNIKGGRIDYRESEEFIDPAEYDSVMSRGKIEIGDVLFTTEAPLGEAANADRTDVALAQRIIKFCGQQGILSNVFLKYWIMGSFCQADLVRLATGSTALGIKGSKLGQVRICLPPIDEQRQIERHLDDVLEKTASLNASAANAIELLLERRAALISAAVTGQIDVRGLADTKAA